MNELISILIVDDHPVVREGLRALIESLSDFELADEAVDGCEAVIKARDLDPDVILMDLVMPKKDGITAIQEILQHNPAARILVLTSFAENENVLSAIKAGAKGYLLKDSMPQQLIQAIKAIDLGDTWFQPSLTSCIMKELPGMNESRQNASLTERESEVLCWMAKGYSNESIAKKLAISKETVRTHIGNIFHKINVENRTQACLYALRQGIINLDEIEK